MPHEFETCSCALCLSFRRVFSLLYAREASGALQRRGVELLRVTHSQLLDFVEAGDPGAATPGEPTLPAEGGEGPKKSVKEEPQPEEEKAPTVPGSAPVVAPLEAEATSPSGDHPADKKKVTEEKKPAEVEDQNEGGEARDKEKKRSSRDRERRRRREKDQDTKEGATPRSRSHHRERRRRHSSHARSPVERGRTTHSHSRKDKRERKSDRRSPRSPIPSPREVVSPSPGRPLPSRASGLTNAQKRAIPPPPKPPPVKVPREPDHPPPGYSSWQATDVRSKSWAYREPPPNKGRKKDERNTNFRLWREYEREYY